MTTRNKRKLATLNKEICEENPRSNLAQNSGAPRSQEDYITQVSEETEGRVTKRLSKEFSRTENRILGALARLDDFIMNPFLPGHSGTTPEPTRNTSHNNQGTNEDGSQNDPHPEAGLFHGQTTRNASLEEGHDKYTPLNQCWSALTISESWTQVFSSLPKYNGQPTLWCCQKLSLSTLFRYVRERLSHILPENFFHRVPKKLVGKKLCLEN